MIKSIKPGVLANLSDAEIEMKLEQHFGCSVAYCDGVVKIYCIDDYDDENETKPYSKLLRDMRKLNRVGMSCLAYDRTGPHVRLTFNAVAMDVISGERARREAKRIKNKQGEKQ